jgi:hypothetical protein
VLEKGEGTFIVGRRTDRAVSASDYLPCIYCKVFYYLSRDLSRHATHCKFQPYNKNADDKTTGKHVVSHSRMLLEGAMKQKYRPTSETKI